MEVKNLDDLSYNQEVKYLQSVLSYKDNLHAMVLAWANATERLVDTSIKWLVQDFTAETLVNIIENSSDSDFYLDNDYFTIGNDDDYIVGYYNHEIKSQILCDIDYYSTEILREYIESQDIDIATIEWESNN